MGPIVESRKSKTRGRVISGGSVIDTWRLRFVTFVYFLSSIDPYCFGFIAYSLTVD
jgi:hypothetical protein